MYKPERISYLILWIHMICVAGLTDGPICLALILMAAIFGMSQNILGYWEAAIKWSNK